MRSQGGPWERGEEFSYKINTHPRSQAPAWERVKILFD